MESAFYGGALMHAKKVEQLARRALEGEQSGDYTAEAALMDELNSLRRDDRTMAKHVQQILDEDKKQDATLPAVLLRFDGDCGTVSGMHLQAANLEPSAKHAKFLSEYIDLNQQTGEKTKISPAPNGQFDLSSEKFDFVAHTRAKRHNR